MSAAVPAPVHGLRLGEHPEPHAVWSLEEAAWIAQRDQQWRLWAQDLAIGAAVGPARDFKPVALIQFLEGLLSTWGRPPTEHELRAAAHALTVRADRIACARTQESDGA